MVEVKIMIDLVVVKRDMLQYEQDVRALRGMCKVRLVGIWIKRREVVVGARRIKSKKLREHQYREGYARSLESMGVEENGNNNIASMWEQKV